MIESEHSIGEMAEYEKYVPDIPKIRYTNRRTPDFTNLLTNTYYEKKVFF